MSVARDEILSRVRRGLADVPEGERPEDVPVPRAYLQQESAGTLERFIERVTDYGATVRVVRPDGLVVAIDEACREHGVRALVMPADVPPDWIPLNVAAVVDLDLQPAELDRLGAALTGCALAIAETGTVVLDCGPRQGRRALTLVADVHICVVQADQVVDGVPAALRLLGPGLRDTRRPVTFVSGPSATSDIELLRVEGVHGPRQLGLIVVRG